VAIEDAYELAYREAVRALEHQRADLTELRGRASMLLAAASITLSLLGRGVVRAPHSLGWMALVCFALLSLSVLAIVWPHEDWSVDVDPQALIASGLSLRNPDLSHLGLELIAHMARHRQLNNRRLRHVARMFRIGACFLAMQIVLTIAAATGIV